MADGHLPTPQSNRPNRLAATERGRTSPIAGLFALFFVGGVIFQLYVNLPLGGISPETVLFLFLAIIFGALWWFSRRPGELRLKRSRKPPGPH